MRAAMRAASIWVAVAVVLAGTAVAEAAVIELRSGQAADGQADPAITYVSGPSQTPLSSLAFNYDDWNAALSGSNPTVVNSTAGVFGLGAWVHNSAFDDGLSKWVSTGDLGEYGGLGETALFAQQFYLASLPAGGQATLNFTWAADDRLGDLTGEPNPAGVYLNGHPIWSISGGGFHAGDVMSVSNVDVKAFLQQGENALYVYDRDMLGSSSGVIYHAELTITPEPTTLALLALGVFGGLVGRRVLKGRGARRAGGATSLAVVLMVGAMLLSPGQSGQANTVVSTWIGGTGLWDTSGDWNPSTPSYPHNGGGTTYQAVIDSGTVQLDRSDVVIDSLDIGPSGTLDIGNHPLLIHYGNQPSPIQTIRDMIASAYDGGAWNGTGITSSYAVANGCAIAYIDGADGVVDGLAPGYILIRIAQPGDANLDEVVDLGDKWILIANYDPDHVNPYAFWDNADFNYDGFVDSADLAIWAQGGCPGCGVSPEPATLALLLLGGVSLAGRAIQRRK